jgi:hypothetical protein
MKRMYLVITAVVVIAVMAVAAWKFSTKCDSSDSSQDDRSARQKNEDPPPMIDGHVVVLPPTSAPLEFDRTSEPNTSNFKMPPDTARPGADTQPVGAPEFVVPPSNP